MMMKKAIHCFITGRVQGVFFRQETKQMAQALGLMGWVKNLPDGRVEVMASGAVAEVEQLHSWLQHGPAMAQVANLECEEVKWEEFDSFTIVY